MQGEKKNTFKKRFRGILGAAYRAHYNCERAILQLYFNLKFKDGNSFLTFEQMSGDVDRRVSRRQLKNSIFSWMHRDYSKWLIENRVLKDSFPMEDYRGEAEYKPFIKNLLSHLESAPYGNIMQAITIVQDNDRGMAQAFSCPLYYLYKENEKFTKVLPDIMGEEKEPFYKLVSFLFEKDSEGFQSFFHPFIQTFCDVFARSTFLRDIYETQTEQEMTADFYKNKVRGMIVRNSFSNSKHTRIISHALGGEEIYHPEKTYRYDEEQEKFIHSQSNDEVRKSILRNFKAAILLGRYDPEKQYDAISEVTSMGCPAGATKHFTDAGKPAVPPLNLLIIQFACKMYEESLRNPIKFEPLSKVDVSKCPVNHNKPA